MTIAQNEMPIIPGLFGMIRETLEAAALRYLKKKIIELIIKALPFLGGGFFAPIISVLASKFAPVILEWVSTWIDFGLIDWDLYRRDKAYAEARSRAMELFLKPREANDAIELEKLRKEMEDRASDLIRIRPNVFIN